ncbi:hypothetical protein V8D89_009870 [Ganoderma adspersum]
MRISYGLELLGEGRHGQVWVTTVTMAAHSEYVGGAFAMKKAPVTNHIRHPMLLHEACALVLLQGHPSIPKAIAWGRSQYFEYLVMERLESSLDDTIKAPGYATKLTLRNLVILMYQMLDVVEHVHDKGIVHCDVKPRNFVFGSQSGGKGRRLHLVDFGLSRPWIDPKTGEPFPEELNSGFRGTLHFASRHVHLGHTPSRRDDVESIAYTLVKLLTGTLPWADAETAEEVLPILYAHSGRTLCHGYDDVFAQFVDYARGLRYDETPKYQHWRQAFLRLVPSLSVDAAFDAEDDSEPRVGVQKNFDRLRCEDAPKPPAYVHSDPFQLRVYGDASASSTGGKHGFMPNQGSSWSCGTAIRAGDVFGDEFAVVKESVELIDAPPDYSEGSCVYPGVAPPEEMKNDQSDSHRI